MRRLLFLPVLVILTSGCVKQHHQKGISGGLDQMRQDNVFRVECSDADLTELSKARDLALLRCADTTIEHGYQYFIILHQNGFGENESQSGVIPVYIIKCFQEKPEDITETTAFEATQTRKKIRQRYKLD